MSKTAPQKRMKHEAQLSDDFRWLASTAPGKRILDWIFGWCGVFNEIDETDPIKLGMEIGANNVAKRIARYVTMEPDIFTSALNSYTSAMRENNDGIRSHIGTDDYHEHMAHLMGWPQASTGRVPKTN